MDASGKPIQSYQAPQQQAPARGVTLNSNPNQWAFNNALINSMGRQASQEGADMSQSGLPGWQKPAWTGPTFSDISNMRAANGPNPMGAGAPNANAASAMQPASAGNNYQAALTALAHPNPVQTPGAAYTPMGQQQNPTNSILHGFLQNWQQGGMGRQSGPGIGGGSSGISFGANNPFLKSLQGM
jgi:hypothetical protein